MVMNIFITRLKCLLRSKANIFWTFFFPILLGTFFYFGFGNLNSDSFLNTTKAYMANDKMDEILVSTMSEVKIEEETYLFEVNTNYSKGELETQLEEGKISGYIYINDDKIYYRMKENGLTQTITKSFLDQYIQVNSLVELVLDIDPTILPDVLNDLNNNISFTEKIQISTNPNTNMFIIYFYALIAMACMFGSYWGIGLINDIQANFSPLAARVNITPTKKWKLIIFYFLAALLVHYSGILALIAYLKFILQIEFSNNILLILLGSLVGSMSGIALGCIISAMVKGSFNTKEGISTLVSLSLSFLSGLMVINVKYLIEKNIPVLGVINPANLLTNTFYSLYYYSDTILYFKNLWILLGLTILFLLGSYLRLRGSKYDSI